MTKIRILSLLCVTGVAWQLWAADPPGTLAANSPDISNKTQTVSPDDLQKLKERIAQQENEIKKLQKSVEEQQQMLNSAIQGAVSTNTTEAASGSLRPTGELSPATLQPVSNLSPPGLAPSGRWQKAVTERGFALVLLHRQHDLLSLRICRFHILYALLQHHQRYRDRLWRYSVQQHGCR